MREDHVDSLSTFVRKMIGGEFEKEILQNLAFLPQIAVGICEGNFVEADHCQHQLAEFALELGQQGRLGRREGLVALQETDLDAQLDHVLDDLQWSSGSDGDRK